VQERREQMAERLRSAVQARDLPTELERRLKEEGGRDLEPPLSQLDQLAQDLPEADRIRWYIESAAGSARVGRPGKADTEVSRSRAALEGQMCRCRRPAEPSTAGSPESGQEGAPHGPVPGTRLPRTRPPENLGMPRGLRCRADARPVPEAWRTSAAWRVRLLDA
jgi:hypothetical protein